MYNYFIHFQTVAPTRSLVPQGVTLIMLAKKRDAAGKMASAGGPVSTCFNQDLYRSRQN